MTDIISTDSAPAAIGPYSQAVKSNGLVYCSGQISLDPVTGSIVGEDIAAQTQRVLENLKAVLEAAGSGLDKAVKVTVYLANISDFKAMNDVYAEYFTGKPARATVEVARLPKDALVEIDVIAEL